MKNVTVKVERIKLYPDDINSTEYVRALTYTYWCSRDMGFRFHLCSEVGQPWIEEARAKAQALAKKHGCVVKQVELDRRPWYVDALVKEEETAEV